MLLLENTNALLQGYSSSSSSSAAAAAAA